MAAHRSARSKTPADWIPTVAAANDLERAPRRGAILVVEDRDDVRQGLAHLLELHGYLVEDARTGEDAIRQLTSEPEGFALILLDLMLPGEMSGHDVRMQQLADPRENRNETPPLRVSNFGGSKLIRNRHGRCVPAGRACKETLCLFHRRRLVRDVPVGRIGDRPAELVA